MRFKLGLCGIALLAVGLAGCGGGSTNSGGGGGGKPTLESISVSPSGPLTVGTDQQFTATGHMSDGSTKDLTKSATWSSSDTTIATITSPGGKATPIKHGAVTITATSSSINGSVGVTVNAVLQSIAISPIGPAVEVGKSVAFTATGSFNDNTQSDVTSATSFASSDATKASFSGNQATGVAAGAVTVTATDGSVNAATSLHVVASPAPPLNGTYAFTLFGADSRGTQFYAGSFTADGNGNITGGVEDANTVGGVETNVAVSGTYVQYPDGRGDFNLAINSIHPAGITLRYVTNSTGTAGKFIEFDGAGTLRGSFELQSIGDTLSAGSYVFRLSGANAIDNGEMGELGVINTSGTGNITSGTIDLNDHGTVSGPAALLASTYTAPDGNGRGTLTLGTSNFVYYVVDFNKINLVQIDATAPTTALGGVAELQQVHTFVDADLNGGFAFLLEHPVIVGNPNRGEFNTLGVLLFDGTQGVIGSPSGSEEDEDEAAANPQQILNGSYHFVGGVNGRGTTTITVIESPSNVVRTMLFYMVSTSKMFVMRTFNGVNGVDTAPTGVGELQSGPLNKGNLNGSYLLAASELSEENVENLGLLDFDGNGNFSGVVDTSIAGVLSSNVLSGGTYSVVSGTGRGPLISTVPENNYIMYLLGSQRAYVMGVKGTDTDGTLELR